MNRKFTGVLVLLFSNVWVKNEIRFLQIKARAKSLPGFWDKIYRVAWSGRKFSNESSKLFGLRLITNYPENIFTIVYLIERYFRAHSKNADYYLFNRFPDQFGYSTIHYKISLLPDMDYGIDTRGLLHLKVKVQIRSVVQNAWATMDHKMRFKITGKILKFILRQIFQFSTFFELADDRLTQIKYQLENLAREAFKRYEAGDLAVRINAYSIGYFF